MTTETETPSVENQATEPAAPASERNIYTEMAEQLISDIPSLISQEQSKSSVEDLPQAQPEATAPPPPPAAPEIDPKEAEIARLQAELQHGEQRRRSYQSATDKLQKRIDDLEKRLSQPANPSSQAEVLQEVLSDPNKLVDFVDTRAEAKAQAILERLGITPELIQDQRYQSDVRNFRSENPESNVLDFIATEYVRALPENVKIDKVMLESLYGATAKVVAKLRPLFEQLQKANAAPPNPSVKPGTNGGSRMLSPAEQEQMARQSTALQRNPSVAASDLNQQPLRAQDFPSRRDYHRANILRELERTGGRGLF